MERYSLKMPVKGKPYAHQQAAFDFICGKFGLTTLDPQSGGCALLMEMGCGKSLVALAAMGRLSLLGQITRALIVCPLSIMGVWEEEMGKFASYPYTIKLLRGVSGQEASTAGRDHREAESREGTSNRGMQL